MNAVDTERAGLPSGSGAYRWLNCAGSHLAESEFPDVQSPAAAEGEKIHEFLAGRIFASELTEEQERCAIYAQEQTRKLNEMLLGEGAQVVDIDQKRYWLRNEQLEPVSSCRLDWISKSADGAAFLVIDYKFGRRAVEPADVNAQLRFAAAVTWQEFSARRVFVAIIAPRAEGERTTIAEFTAAQCKAAHDEMTAGSMQAVKPGQPRSPSSKACLYCRAKGTVRCPESVANVTELATVNSTEISAEVISTLLDRCEMAEGVIAAIRAEAKKRIGAGQNIVGWRLKPGAKKMTIIDARAAWAKVGVQIGGAAFADCCTVSLPELAKAFKASSTEKVSEKDARAKVEAMLTEAGALEEKQNAPSLTREAA